jgi:hypothetical protein
MREETKKRRAKRDKIKKELRAITKDLKLGKLSKHEENQYLLNSLKQRNRSEEENTEQPVALHINRRSFICPCGCKVTLEGDPTVKKNKEGKELCSKCSLF